MKAAAAAQEDSLECIHEDLDRYLASGEEDVARSCDPVYRRHQLEPRGRTMVELGCGIGRMSRAFARRFGLVLGIDARVVKVQQARALHQEVANLHFYANDGHLLARVPDETVDLCFSHTLFQQLPTSQAIAFYLHEFARVLRPGGLAHFQVKGRRRAGPAAWLLPTPEGIGVEFTTKGTEAALTGAGFRPVETTSCGDGRMWVLGRKPWTA